MKENLLSKFFNRNILTVNSSYHQYFKNLTAEDLENLTDHTYLLLKVHEELLKHKEVSQNDVLVFHKNSRDCVKPYKNPLNYCEYINMESKNEEFINYLSNKKSLNPSWFLDEFLLTLNLHKYNIKTASLQEDFPELNITAHTSDAREIKIQHLKDSIKILKTIHSIFYF